MNTINEDFPALTVKLLDNGNLRLEDPGYSEGAIVDIHPAQLRMLAEKIGLIAPTAVDTNEQATYAEQSRTIDRLQRNMLRIRGHALQLQDDLRKADWDHADLTVEMMKANSLVDLCDLAVDDFADDYHARDPGDQPTGSDRVSPGLPMGSPTVSKAGNISGLERGAAGCDAQKQLELAGE